MADARVVSEEAAAYIAATVASIADEEELIARLIAAFPYEESIAQLTTQAIALGMAQKVLAAVDSAIKTGVVPPEFKAGSLGDLIAEGLSKGDPRLAFQAGLRTAYNFGRYERAKAVGAEFLVYRAITDSRTRETHRKLNGVALPMNDAFWKTHYPPNGFNCRCIAYASDAQGLKDLEEGGVRVQRKAPDEDLVEHEDKITGEKITLPESVQPGWQYGPEDGTKQMEAVVTRGQKALS